MMKIRKILSFTVALGFIIGASTVTAHAEWKSSAGKWYYSENGTNKTGWLQDGSNWYYLGFDGIMKTGWIEDKGTWYYLIDNGTLDNSRTSTTMPAEIQKVYDMVKPFADQKKFELKYVGLYHTRYNDCFTNAGMEETTMYAFRVSDEYDIPIAEYYYNPQTGIVYKMVQGVVTNLGTPQTIYDLNKKISKDAAIQNVKNYLATNKITIPNLIVEASDEYANSYVVRCISDSGDHINTAERYYVDKATGNVIDALMA